MKLLKLVVKVGNLSLLSGATAVQSRQTSHTFTVILTIFAPQPWSAFRWCQKPWKGLLNVILTKTSFLGLFKDIMAFDHVSENQLCRFCARVGYKFLSFGFALCTVFKQRFEFIRYFSRAVLFAMLKDGNTAISLSNSWKSFSSTTRCTLQTGMYYNPKHQNETTGNCRNNNSNNITLFSYDNV